MNTRLITRDQATTELRRLSDAGSGAVRAPDDLAQVVLKRAHGRRRRRHRIGWGIGATLAVMATAAAASLGNSDYYTVTQPSPVMEPAIKVGEHVIFSRAVTPQHGDVVLVHWDPDGGVPFEGMSRVMGREGDVVSCPRSPRGGCDSVLINGAPVKDPYLAGLVTQPFDPVSVPDDSVFALGDDRMIANDSRTLGAVDLSDIAGVAVRITSADTEDRAVPGAPVHEGPGDNHLIDPPEQVPTAPSGPTN